MDLKTHMLAIFLSMTTIWAIAPQDDCNDSQCTKPPSDAYMTRAQVEAFAITLSGNLPHVNYFYYVSDMMTNRHKTVVFNIKPYLKPGSRNGVKKDHKAVWIEAGFIANISMHTSIAANLVYNLAHNCKQHCDYDYYIIPLVNTDGYEYAMASNASWTKSYDLSSQATCKGTDLTRNFNTLNFGFGGSTLECANDFVGYGPFSDDALAYNPTFKSPMSQSITLTIAMMYDHYGCLFPSAEQNQTLYMQAPSMCQIFRDNSNLEFPWNNIDVFNFFDSSIQGGHFVEYNGVALGIQNTYVISFPNSVESDIAQFSQLYQSGLNAMLTQIKSNE